MPVKRLDLDEWLWLVDGGEDPVRAAKRCGVTISSVARIAHRQNRDDIAQIAEHARSVARHHGEAA